MSARVQRKPQKHGWWDRRDVRQFKGKAPHFNRWAKRYPPPPSMLPPWAQQRQERAS